MLNLMLSKFQPIRLMLAILHLVIRAIMLNHLDKIQMQRDHVIA
jgi:hypothetical protein